MKYNKAPNRQIGGFVIKENYMNCLSKLKPI